MNTQDILAVIAALTIIWNGWLSLKHFEIQKKYDNLCADCEFDFTPKKGAQLPKAS